MSKYVRWYNVIVINIIFCVGMIKMTLLLSLLFSIIVQGSGQEGMQELITFMYKMLALNHKGYILMSLFPCAKLLDYSNV